MDTTTPENTLSDEKLNKLVGNIANGLQGLLPRTHNFFLIVSPVDGLNPENAESKIISNMAQTAIVPLLIEIVKHKAGDPAFMSATVAIKNKENQNGNDTTHDAKSGQ